MKENELKMKQKITLYGLRTSTKVLETAANANNASTMGMGSYQMVGVSEALEGVPQAKPGCADAMIISRTSRWKAVFDIWILLLVGYSCFTSMF